MISPFVARVIDSLNGDDFLRQYKDNYFATSYLMDKDADKRSCAIDAGWVISVFDAVLFTNVELERGHVRVPLSWKEKRALLKAFNNAIYRLKHDRKEYLQSLKD